MLPFMRARALASPRPVSGLDLAAKAAALALPGLEEPIDRIRHDARAIVDQTTGHREPSFRDRSTAPRPLTPLDDVSLLAALLPRRWSERLRQMGRDLRFLTGRLRGEPTPFLVERRHRPTLQTAERFARRASPIRLRPLTVVRVVRETPDAVSLYLREASGQPIEFTAGQFLSFDVEVEGEVHRRAYSLASAALPGREPHVTVKRVDGGKVSNFLNDHAHEGMVLDVLGPSGAFTLDPASGVRHLVSIAGGSGITPIVSIVETALEASPATRVTLLYGNRSEEDIIFRDRLGALAERHGERFRVEHVLETPSATWSGPRGRLDGATLMDRLGVLSHEDDGATGYFVCGPSGMMDAVRDALIGSGVDAQRIREERFSRPEDRVSVGPALEPQQLTIRAGGRTAELVTDGETVLEAGLSAGLPMPFSCAMGGCGACRVKVRSGQMVMEEPNCLTAQEREAGYVLACVARATTPCEVEVEQ